MGDLWFKLESQNFDFIKILAQIIVKFQNFERMKNNLICAEMIKLL